MEETSTPERLIMDEEVVAALKNGLENPATNELYNKWLDQLEADRTEDSLYDIKVSVRRAKVYYKARFPDQAIADLEETFLGAVGETGEGSELCMEIQSILGKMRKSEQI